jgi:hypothetical protein
MTTMDFLAPVFSTLAFMKSNKLTNTLISLSEIEVGAGEGNRILVSLKWPMPARFVGVY